MPWPVVSFACSTNAAILAPNTSLVFLLALKLSPYSSAVLSGMVKRPAILHLNMTHETAQVFRFRDFQGTEEHFRDFDGTEERAFAPGNVQKWTTFTYIVLTVFFFVITFLLLLRDPQNSRSE